MVVAVSATPACFFALVERRFFGVAGGDVASSVMADATVAASATRLASAADDGAGASAAVSVVAAWKGDGKMYC
jgi:hypothetical protein